MSPIKHRDDDDTEPSLPTRIIRPGPEDPSMHRPGAQDTDDDDETGTVPLSEDSAEAETKTHKKPKVVGRQSDSESFGSSGGPTILVGPNIPKQHFELPTGCLLIVRGKGRGKILPIPRETSTVGRGEDQRIRIDFGDNSISAHHATVSYDPPGHKFWIANASGKITTRVNGESALTQRELKSFDEIQIGNTYLKFFPFCGENFDWEREIGKEKAP
ncbi:MAG TPA: FHA domain-containing protein [Verrucomicrobiae bacterium]|nr:FHA domain-containing protein [Verrucomicrobiae bacterium]